MKIIFILLLLLTSSCIHRSTLVRENDSNKKYAVEYCGGKIWGYVKPVDQNGLALLAVYTNYTTLSVDNKKALVLYVAFRFKSSTDLIFKNKKLRIEQCHINKSTTSDFDYWLMENFKSAHDKFDDKYEVRPGNSEKEYLVYKKRWGGFIGSAFLMDPFIYNQPFVENRKIDGLRIKFDLDPSEHDDFILVATKILFINDLTEKGVKFPEIPAFAKLSVFLPEFTLNNINYKLDPFVINFDKNKIDNKSSSRPGCPSMGMMFHWNNGFSLLPTYMID